MKLPVVNDGGKLPPSKAQSELKVAPVAREGASQPEFPRRPDIFQGGYAPSSGIAGRASRKGASLLVGGAIVAAGALAHAKSETQVVTTKAPKPGKGSIDGAAVNAKAPKIVIYRSSGIGPSEEYDDKEVEAFLNWKFAHDSKLDMKSNYQLEYDEVKVSLDGFDPTRNIGFEFIHGNDYDEFSDAVRKKIGDWMTQKKAAILLIDMDGTPDAPTLSKKVAKFMKDVKKNPPSASPLMGAVEPVKPVPGGNPCDGEAPPPPAATQKDAPAVMKPAPVKAPPAPTKSAPPPTKK
jgi:hypothetical protein